jgi:hypothetical protein
MRTRPGETRFKLLTAATFYHLIARITAMDIPRVTGTSGCWTGRSWTPWWRCASTTAFYAGISVWVGFRPNAVPYDRQERSAGRMGERGSARTMGFHCVDQQAACPRARRLLPRGLLASYHAACWLTYSVSSLGSSLRQARHCHHVVAFLPCSVTSSNMKRWASG